ASLCIAREGAEARDGQGDEEKRTAHLHAARSGPKESGPLQIRPITRQARADWSSSFQSPLQRNRSSRTQDQAVASSQTGLECASPGWPVECRRRIVACW